MLNKLFKELNNKLISYFPNRANLFQIIIFAAWFTLSFLAGVHHEPWADEAQAWLIARDNSFYNLIFSDVLNYEGHPALWYIIVKFFILPGLPYEDFFIIPFLLTAIGMYLFIFKSKFPNYIKALFPFSFYIIFMYPVMARSHSLLFPILASIAVIYKNRLQRPFIYTILLLLLMSVSAHSFAIAAILFLSFCFDIFKNSIENKNINKKSIVCLTAILLGFILTTISVLPMPADIIRMVRSHIPHNFLLSILEPLNSGYFFTKNYVDIITYIKSVLLILMYTLAFFIFCKTKQQKTLFILLPMTLLLIMSKVYYMYWHSGYLVLLFIFVLWILIDENEPIEEKSKLKKLFCIIFSSLLFLQLFYGIKTVLLDIKYPYCGSKNAAYFIKKNNLDKHQIDGIGFKSMSLQPYFKKNLYRTFKTSYWGWNRENYAVLNENAKSGAPVIVTDYGALSSFPQEELKKIEKEYNIYSFEGDMFIFGKSAELNTIIICVKK